MKTGSIVYQTKQTFRSLDAIGQPKAVEDGKIHSIQTMRTYLRHAIEFVTYCRQEHGCKVLADCRPYVKEWIERGDLSPHTRKMERSALAKMYGCKAKDFGEIDTGTRARDTVKRSRGTAARDRHFSENGKYKQYVEFCRSTGLRRTEVSVIKGTAFYRDADGKAWLHVSEGTKGGRYREVPVIGNVDAVEAVCKAAGSKKVIQILTNGLKAPNGADTHSYRSDYATALYRTLARPAEDVPRWERYYCRNDKAGVVLDRGAMEQVSQALGHTRISVIAQSYLR